MEQSDRKVIIVRAQINTPVKSVWKCWTTPADIVHWNAAQDDWHTTRAENDLRTGGKFLFRMEARDGSMGFDFLGEYDKVVVDKEIHYTLGDGRKVQVTFSALGDRTDVVESFEAENVFPHDQQREGWQAILNNFKKYAETRSKG